MIHFFPEYALFLAKTTTFVIAILLIAGFIIGLASKGKGAKEQLIIKKINARYDSYKATLNGEVLTKPALKQALKQKKKQDRALKKQFQGRKRIFVLDFNGDIKASATSALREEVTAILTIATPDDEVLVKIESPGGIVANYGLAAAQLKRLREKNIHLKASIDTVAASGGYMMAAIAEEIFAAPYAIVGSIGVVAQMPNFHRLLKKNNVDFVQITAGEYKRTLSVFGENTEKGLEKVQEDVNNVHEIFKKFILEHRPQVNIAQVATGEHWHGVQALDLKLVDHLATSDHYLLEQSSEKDIYEVRYSVKKTLAEKIAFSMQALYYRWLGNKSSYEIY